MTPPLVLLHGFTGSPAGFDGLLQALPGVTAHRPALLGHGPPDAATASVQSFDNEVARLLELFPREPVHLAGYSLGARLALGIALSAPGRVARLTLVSGQPGLATEPEREARRHADARWCALLESRGIEAFADAWAAQPLFATQGHLPAATREHRRQERLRHDPRGLARSLRVTGLGEMPDYGPRLAALTLPVTLLVGELDAKFLTLGRTMAAALPQARLTIAPSAGHDLLLERPDLVALELSRAF